MKKEKKKENIRDFYSSNFQTIMILNYESNVNESDDDELLLCYRNVEKSNKEAKKKKMKRDWERREKWSLFYVKKISL